MLYKNCPRCTGDMYLERGSGYSELVCLQCGHRRNVEERPAPATLRARTVKEQSKRVAA